MDNELLQYVSGQRLSNLILVASASLLGYDYLLSISDEVQFIMLAPWNLGKVLYCLNRYLPVVDMPVVLYLSFSETATAAQCRWLHNWVLASWTIGLGVANAILVMRTWVIWGATIPMGVVLGSISICSSVAISVLMVLFAQSFQYAASPTPIIRGCFVSGVNNLIATIWAIILGNELFLLFATMSRGLRHITQGKPGTLNTLYWDALKFTGLLSLISIVSLVTAIAAPPSYQTAPSPLQRVLHSILASHVMLRLRRVSQMPAPEGSGTEGTLFHVDSTAVYQSRTGIAER